MLNFKVTIQEQTNNKGTFIIEPLEVGFGHTVGNCLRRVLLSNLEGAAIDSIKIDGISHPFSTLSGVVEDVMEIILNLKKVRLNIFSDQPIKMALKASGKGEVKASSIDTLGGGEIINSDLRIATLTSPSAKLNIEMVAQKGKGYIMTDEKKTTGALGVILIDSIYSPVLTVNYSVEPTRVGRSTNFDKLILHITTDSTVKPESALNSAAEILSGYFKQIFDPTIDEEEPAELVVPNEVLKLFVEELDLPVRITNALRAADIDIVEKLIQTPKSQLLKIKNLGVQSVNLMAQKLKERDLTLSEA